MTKPRARQTSFEDEVVKAIRKLRPGDVASYGEIAAEAGSPRAARAVGRVLARSEGLPWWRIVRADGRLVAPHEREQARLLKREGVHVLNGKVFPRSGDAGRGPVRAAAGPSDP